MTLPDRTVAKMIQAARDGAPYEVCGVIVDGWAIQVENVAPDPESFFVTDMRAVQSVYEERGGIDGVWHSHPGGRVDPSSTDLENHPDGVPMLYIVTLEDVHEYAQ